MSAGATSVVMATFNGERFLDEQLASILGQLRGQDELIIVDDASTDSTPRILRALNCAQARIVGNAANLGVRKSFERGLSMARHPIVFLSDQDDVWLPGKRDAFAAAFAQRPDVDVVVSDAQVIDAAGGVLAPSFMAGRGGFAGSFLANLVRNRFLGCAMAVRRRVLDLALPIPAHVPQHDMWLGALASLTGAVLFLDTPYLRYRRHSANVTAARPAPLPRMIWWRLMLLAAVAARMTRGGLLGRECHSAERE